MAGRLAGILAAFIVLATVAVTLREYRAGTRRLVGDTDRDLSIRTDFAADRLAVALNGRARLAELWAGLETAQDLAVDDIDQRLSTSLSELVTMLRDGSEAVAARGSRHVLASSEPARLTGDSPPLPWVVSRALERDAAGMTIIPATESREGILLMTADVRSRVDGSSLGRIVVWTPLTRFLSGELPLDVEHVALRDSRGTVLFMGEGFGSDPAHYLQAQASLDSPAGPLQVEMSGSLEDLNHELRATARQLITLAGLFLVLALPATLLVVRSATSGLGTLTHAARDMDATQEHHVLPTPSKWAPREVQVLAEAMGSMVARLERAREELARSEALAAVGMITKSLAHEIRTPLSVLKAGAEMLLRSPAPDSREREVIGMIHLEVDRLARLMDDLLVFGRPSPPRIQDVGLDRIAVEAVGALAPQAGEAGVALHSEIHDAPLRGDPDQLRQIALNLVSNGIRACEGGGSVTVRTYADHGEACLEVEDDGTGIPPDRLPEIWQPLVTTHRSGSGLGLPIVKQLTEAHAGRVEVTSTPGHGTCMRVMLPVDGPEAP